MYSLYQQLSSILKTYLPQIVAGILLGTIIFLPQVSTAQTAATVYVCEGFNLDCLVKVITWFVDILLYAIGAGFAFIMYISAATLNFAFVELVIKMKTWIDSIPAIYLVWQTARDLTNIGLIFITLYIAIQTILGKDEKSLLVRLVLVALFINFSFFFASILIDLSNIGATFFYRAIATNTATGSAELATTVLNTLQIIGSDTNQNPTAVASLHSASQDIGKLLIIRISNIIILGALAGIFTTIAYLLIYRFITLMIILMVSSFCFAAQVLPSTKKYFDDWWDRLVTQCLAAPVLFLYLWVVFVIMESLAPKMNTSLLSAIQTSVGTNSLNELPFVLISYGIIIFLLYLTPVVVNSLSMAGASHATALNAKLQNSFGLGFAGRTGLKFGSSLVRGTAQVPGRVVQGVGLITKAATLGTFGQSIVNKGTQTVNYGKAISTFATKPIENVKVYGKTIKEYEQTESLSATYQKLKKTTTDEYKSEEKKSMYLNAVAAFKKDPTNSSLQKTLDDATEALGKDIVTMDPKVIASGARSLTKAQLEAIEKSDEFFYDTKKEILDARKKANLDKIAATISSGGNVAKTVQKMGDEITNFKTTEFTPDILENLSEEQWKTLKASDKFSPSEKANFERDYINKHKATITAAAATGTQQQAVRKLGNKVSTFKVADFTPEIAGNLSKEQITGIKESNNFTDTEFTTIMAARAQYHLNKVTNALPGQKRKAVKEIGDAITAFSTNTIISNSDIINNLTESQLKYIEESDRPKAEKDRIQQARFINLRAAGDVSSAKAALGNLSTSEIVKVGMSILTRPHVAAVLSPAALQSIIKETTQSERVNLKAALNRIYDRGIVPAGINTSANSYQTMKKWYNKNEPNL